jgi:CheY-like chemotaxis protein
MHVTPSSRTTRVIPSRQPKDRTLWTPQSEYVRIARALLGVTPAELAAHIGLPGPIPAAETFRPTHTLYHLSTALAAIIGCYDDAFGHRRTDTDTLSAGQSPLEELIERYLELRSTSERRAAAAMAARSAEPHAAVPAGAIAPPPQAASSPAVPAVRALLVDDVADVVIIVAAFLQTFGFDVTRASNADDALRILTTGSRIDLLVTDHAMPGMTGMDLVTQAMGLQPHLRALIITGYPDAAELAALPEHTMLLPKPFRRNELAERVHALLDARANCPTAASSRPHGSMLTLVADASEPVFIEGM